MMISTLKKIFLLCCFVVVILSHPTYRDAIPNGHSVPNPGPEGGIWAGVGHFAPGGGGPRNPFGLDFSSQKHRWTKRLCKLDSDGDGRSNGVELGDPDCNWRPGQTPDYPAQSHPGIVDEPIQMTDEGPCAHYTPQDDEIIQDVVFTKANHINESQTHYMCEQYEIEAPTNDLVYHQIKTEVLLDNEDVLHHMWIYQCSQDSSDGNKVGGGSYDCNGMEANCVIIAGWAVGAGDWCEPPNVGARISFPRNTKKIVLKIEAHYDNSLHQRTRDRSGMRLHLTPTLRPIDNGMVILGMDYWDRQFKIPPQQQEYEIVNICPSAATEMLTHPVWVYSWTPHMHLYGTRLLTEHYRCGIKIGELGRIDSWDFNNQRSYRLPQPIKILPGDAIVTTCTYNSSKESEKTILGGESTLEEMCDNYLAYYPWVGTFRHPDLFSECVSFQRGMNPAFVGHQTAFSSFAILNSAGTVYVTDYEKDPTNNVAQCCFSNTCEEDFLSRSGKPCGVKADCSQPANCVHGLCVAI